VGKLKALEINRVALNEREIVSRSIGAMIGMAVADSLGHIFYFDHEQN